MAMPFEGPTIAGTAARLEWIERGVARITLTRPAEMNTVSQEFIAEFDQALDLLGSVRTRALIVTGQDRAFCCGGGARIGARDPRCQCGVDRRVGLEAQGSAAFHWRGLHVPCSPG